jgi:hypothetical protein
MEKCVLLKVSKSYRQDGQMIRCADGWADGRNGWTERMDGTDGRTDGRRDGGTDGWTEGTEGRQEGWLGGRMDGGTEK